MKQERRIVVDVEVGAGERPLALAVFDGARSYEAEATGDGRLRVTYGWVVGASKHDVVRRLHGAGLSVLRCDYVSQEARRKAGSGPKFLDVENLAGVLTLGAVEAGWDLVGARRMPGAFGLACLESNRHLVPGGWQAQAGPWTQWEPQDGVGAVFATPPCSGFSTMTGHMGADRHGPGATQNECMKAVLEYAGSRVTGTDGGPGPEIVIFESVQQAGKKGLVLMRELRGRLEELTGQAYALHHLFHSCASLGGSQARHRYYFAAARVPFGVHAPDVMASPPGRVGTTVAGADSAPDHVYPQEEPQARRVLDVWDSYKANGSLKMALTAALSERGEADVRAAWQHRVFPLDSPKAWGGSVMLDPLKLGRVVDGAGGWAFVHWDERRFLSVRECARLMGLPDAWRYTAASGMNQAFAWTGKSVTLQTARWVARCALDSLAGGARLPVWRGRETGEREFTCDMTHDYRERYDPKTGEDRDTRSPAWRAQQEARREEAWDGAEVPQEAS